MDAYFCDFTAENCSEEPDQKFAFENFSHNTENSLTLWDVYYNFQNRSADQNRKENEILVSENKILGNYVFNDTWWRHRT